MPTYLNIDGNQKEIESFCHSIDGVKTELNSLYASIDGVNRLIFSPKIKWYKFAVRTYFGDYDTSSAVSVTSRNVKNGYVQKYADNYSESGTETISSVTGISVGEYFKYTYFGYGGDYYCYRRTSSYVRGYLVTSYNTKPYGDILETVSSYDETDYPENGLHTDGYWYIRVDKMYRWSKYTIKEVYNWIGPSSRSVIWYDSDRITRYLYQSVSINGGTATLIGTPYDFYLSSNETTNDEYIAEINSGGYKYMASSEAEATTNPISSYCKITSLTGSSNDDDKVTVSYGKYQYSVSNTFDTLIGIVESPNADEYPENGEYNGYWYIKI